MFHLGKEKRKKKEKEKKPCMFGFRRKLFLWEEKKKLFGGCYLSE